MVSDARGHAMSIQLYFVHPLRPQGRLLHTRHATLWPRCPKPAHGTRRGRAVLGSRRTRVAPPGRGALGTKSWDCACLHRM
jgi:hypothetical protein